MRYTTIIDLRDFPQLYRSVSARLIYLHLVLASGYHTEDRDLCGASLRQLEAQTGLTLSAVRHALQQLQKARLVSRVGNSLKVEKFVLSAPILKRPKTQTQVTDAQIQEQQLQQDEKRHREIQEYKDQAARLEALGKTTFMALFEQKQDAARAGDQDAAAFIARSMNIKRYEEHSRIMAERNKKSNEQ